jgi:hypothetical protein
MPGAKVSSFNGSADIVGQSLGPISDWMVLAKMLVELAQQRAIPPLVGNHAEGNLLGKGIEVSSHRTDCSRSAGM